MSVRFERTSFGTGTLVRFKAVKSHPWTHAIYRGTTRGEGGMGVASYDFSDHPLGPITRRLEFWPEFMEAAVPGTTSHSREMES